MLVHSALGRWLNDESRQLATIAEIEALGLRLRNAGPLAALQAELALLEPGNADGILAVAAAFLEQLDDIESIVTDLLRAAATNPFFRPPLRRVASPVHLGLQLVDSPLLSLLLAVATPDALAAKRMTRAESASITFGGQRSILRFLKSGGATLSFWEAPKIGDGFTADSSGRCRMTGRRRIADGETICLDGARETFVIDHASSAIVYLQALTPVGAAPLSVEYDADSLAFAGASSTDEASSRVQMMVSLLRVMDRTDAVPLLREVLRNPHFYVRWHAMREFLALDAEAALPGLREMAASDPHPEVRAAAAQTLEAFFAETDAAPGADPCLA